VLRVASREAEGTPRTRVVVALRRSGHGCIWRYVKSSSRRRLLLYSRARVFIYLDKFVTISYSRNMLGTTNDPQQDGTGRDAMRCDSMRRDATRRDATTHRTIARVTLGMTSERRRRRARFMSRSVNKFSRSIYLRRVVTVDRPACGALWRVVGTIVTYSILVRLSPLVSNVVTTHYCFRTFIGFGKGHFSRDRK